MLSIQHLCVKRKILKVYSFLSQLSPFPFPCLKLVMFEASYLPIFHSINRFISRKFYFDRFWTPIFMVFCIRCYTILYYYIAILYDTIFCSSLLLMILWSTFKSAKRDISLWFRWDWFCGKFYWTDFHSTGSVIASKSNFEAFVFHSSGLYSSSNQSFFVATNQSPR